MIKDLSQRFLQSTLLIVLTLCSSLTLYAEEILYTSTDGKIVTPFATFGFDASIVSNTYEGGKGVIRFNKEITLIGEWAFSNCSNLASVEIPCTVKKIDVGAFRYCTNLTSVTIPTSVTNIEEGAFSYCSKLATITLPQHLTNIGANAFSYCTSLISINIPSTVTNIGAAAFYNCSKLPSITIPQSVANIGGEAFCYCPALSTITIEDGNAVYDSRENCNAIIKTSSNELLFGCKNTTIPNSVTRIGSYAFERCSSLTSITIPNSVTSIGSYAFSYCSKLSSINIPNSVSTIGNYPFIECTNLPIIDNIRYADTYLVETIDKTLASYNIKEGTKWIGSQAFYLCQNLITMDIPNSIKAIGSYAFADCIKLESVVLPNELKTIESNLFYRCSKLSNVNIPINVTKIGATSFAGCAITSITIPESVTNIENDAFSGCNSLKAAHISNLEKWCKIKFESIAANPAARAHHLYLNNEELTNIIIPSSIDTINDFAFCYMTSLTSVTIPKSVMYIGNRVFWFSSSLQNVYCYPKTVPDTGTEVFYATQATKNLYVPKSAKQEYETTSPWNEFTIMTLPYNVLLTDLNGVKNDDNLQSGDSCTITDNIKSVEITEAISDVNLTYTRNFSDAMVNNWQAWYMPCDFDYDDLSEDFDVAEIAGVLFDKDGQNYVAFRKMTEGTVKAHTPYVVRAKEAGDVSITTTTTLQPTDVTKTHTIQSSYNNFTFGGVYENSYLSAEQPTYALNKSGNFALMSESVYLRPFRIYMRITDREDNPYAAVTAPQEVKVVVLGEDETSIDEIHNAQFRIHNDESSEIYNLGGQKLQKLQKGINIVNGRKVLF